MNTENPNRPAAAGRRSSSPPKSSAISQPTRDEIGVRAYEIYVERGGAPGDALSDWLQAERELRSGSVPQRSRQASSSGATERSAK